LVHGTGVNEVQTLTTNGSGTFTITFNGATSTPIIAGFPPSAITSVLQNMTGQPFGVGANNVNITQAGNVYTFTFVNNLAGLDVQEMTAAGSASPMVATTVNGGDANTVQTLTLTGTTGTFTLLYNAIS